MCFNAALVSRFGDSCFRAFLTFSTLRQAEFVVQPGHRDGGRIGEHANRALHLSHIPLGNDNWWLVVDVDLETGGTPVHKLYRVFSFDHSKRCVDVLRNDVTAVHHTAGHVLSLARVTFHHLVCGLGAGVRDLGNRRLLVVGLSVEMTGA